jgi:hypothetical protein
MTCKGCVFDGGCLIQENLLDEECPCKTCIVKVMCSGICDNFKDHYAKIILGSLNKSKNF